MAVVAVHAGGEGGGGGCNGWWVVIYNFFGIITPLDT